MNISVVGAGIGGLAVAHGLLSSGHRVRVLEREPQLTTGGAAVTIFSNGAAALAGLGLRLDGIGARIDRLLIRRSDGMELMRIDVTQLADKSGFETRTIPRGALIRHLASDLAPEIIDFSTPIERIDVCPTGPVIESASGVARHTDVLVGADGYRSIVRRDNLNPVPARDVGWATWQGLSRALPAVAASNSGLLTVGDAGLVGMMPAGDGLLQWWFDIRWSRREPGQASPSGRLREQFSGYAAPVPQLLGEITDDDLGFYPHVVHDVTDTWGTGPVTLLGDAAHAFPPSQAQGANQAIEDAWLLTRALNATNNGVAALRAYERTRAQRVRRVSGLAVSERTNRPPSAALAATSRLIPSTIASRAYTRFIYSISSVLNEDQLLTSSHAI